MPEPERGDDVVEDRVVGLGIVAKPSDPRQTGMFDQPLPKRIKPLRQTIGEHSVCEIMREETESRPTSPAGRYRRNPHGHN